MSEPLVTRITSMEELEMSGAEAMIDLARMLLAGQARGPAWKVSLSECGTITLRAPEPERGFVRYMTGVNTRPDYRGKR